MLKVTKKWKVTLVVLTILFGTFFFCSSPILSQVLLTPATEEEYALLQKYALGTARTFNTEELKEMGIDVTTNIEQKEMKVVVNKQCTYVCATYPVLDSITEVKDGEVVNKTSYDLENGNYTKYQEAGFVRIFERTPMEMAQNWGLYIIISVGCGGLVAVFIYFFCNMLYSLYAIITEKRKK